MFSKVESSGIDADRRNRRESSKHDPRSRLRKKTRPSLRETLQQRLDELIVLEITQEGGRQYHSFSVRQFYNHVLKAVTKHPSIPNAENGMPSSPIHRRRASVSHEGLMNMSEGLPYAEMESFEQSQSSLPTAPGNSRQHRHTASGGDITYRERLGAHLHPRDMRRLVTPFSLTNEPELIVRRHVMLLNFDPLRAVILRDRLLVLVPDGADSLLETLEKRVRGGTMAEDSDIFGEPSNKFSTGVECPVNEQLLIPNKPDAVQKLTPSAYHSASFVSDRQGQDEMSELQTQTWINLSFELQCVDAVLHGVTELLANQAFEIQNDALAAIEYLLRPNTGVGTFAQEMFRASKNNVQNMESRVNGFVRALTIVLNEDEDMALMNLSRLLSHPERFVQPVSAQVLEEESDEPELILEAYLQQAVTLNNQLESMKGQLQTTEGFMNMKSDTVQNRILFVNMLCAIFMMAITMSLFITGIMAMNVPVRFKYGPNGHFFIPLMITIVCAPFALVAAIFVFLRRVGIIFSTV